MCRYTELFRFPPQKDYIYLKKKKIPDILKHILKCVQRLCETFIDLVRFQRRFHTSLSFDHCLGEKKHCQFSHAWLSDQQSDQSKRNEPHEQDKWLYCTISWEEFQGCCSSGKGEVEAIYLAWSYQVEKVDWQWWSPQCCNVVAINIVKGKTNVNKVSIS